MRVMCVRVVREGDVCEDGGVCEGGMCEGGVYVCEDGVCEGDACEGGERMIC